MKIPQRVLPTETPDRLTQRPFKTNTETPTETPTVTLTETCTEKIYQGHFATPSNPKHCTW